ncbi:hypothetical protein [Streptomyces sp. ISL-100]|uniref:hypothetical protein n=1 Tax=Streptomyces sp. ISL-100 TaxID=2819173 RepID=UPI001BE5D65E|nr:hypothetical protein [Streptomyces sp. ISL-100]MBT2398695.1 hypothetical protein [Streptomyces sp. ISL-100]
MVHGFGGGLSEDRADRRGRHLAGVLGDHREDIAQEMSLFGNKVLLAAFRLVDLVWRSRKQFWLKSPQSTRSYCRT